MAIDWEANPEHLAAGDIVVFDLEDPEKSASGAPMKHYVREYGAGPFVLVDSRLFPGYFEINTLSGRRPYGTDKGFLAQNFRRDLFHAAIRIALQEESHD